METVSSTVGSDDRLSQDRLGTLQKELAELKEAFAGKKAQWDNEKASVDKLSRLREEIEAMNSPSRCSVLFRSLSVSFVTGIPVQRDTMRAISSSDTLSCTRESSLLLICLRPD